MTSGAPSRCALRSWREHELLRRLERGPLCPLPTAPHCEPMTAQSPAVADTVRHRYRACRCMHEHRLDALHHPSPRCPRTLITLRYPGAAATTATTRCITTDLHRCFRTARCSTPSTRPLRTAVQPHTVTTRSPRLSQPHPPARRAQRRAPQLAQSSTVDDSTGKLRPPSSDAAMDRAASPFTAMPRRRPTGPPPSGDRSPQERNTPRPPRRHPHPPTQEPLHSRVTHRRHPLHSRVSHRHRPLRAAARFHPAAIPTALRLSLRNTTSRARSNATHRRINPPDRCAFAPDRCTHTIGLEPPQSRNIRRHCSMHGEQPLPTPPWTFLAPAITQRPVTT